MGRERILDPVEAARNRPITTREWGLYPAIFLLGQPPEFWKGKTILDIGSGFKHTDPALVFPGATVAMVDPEWGNRLTENSAHLQRTGIAQNIPYETDMFDLILSSHAVPQQLKYTEMPRVLSELFRVMRSTGEARLVPCARVFHIDGALEKAIARAGFGYETLAGSTEGPIGRFDFKGSAGEKTKAWKEFHASLFPREVLDGNGRFFLPSASPFFFFRKKS